MQRYRSSSQWFWLFFWGASLIAWTIYQFRLTERLGLFTLDRLLYSEGILGWFAPLILGLAIYLLLLLLALMSGVLQQLVRSPLVWGLLLVWAVYQFSLAERLGLTTIVQLIHRKGWAGWGALLVLWVVASLIAALILWAWQPFASWLLRWSGFWSVLLAWTIYQYHWAQGLGLKWIDNLLHTKGFIGGVAFLVLWLTLWVIITLLQRWWKLQGERNLLQAVQYVVGSIRGNNIIDNLDEQILAILNTTYGQLIVEAYKSSTLRQRFLLWQNRINDFNRSDRISFLMMGQSGIESARIETAYGPLRALVWALPSLGFMGTALELSDAIAGIGGMDKVDTTRLLSALMQKVIPALGGAFYITLFALGSSVVCFLFLSLIHLYEENLLHDADALSLTLLAMTSDKRPELLLNDDTSRYLATGLRDLRTVLQVLTWELNKISAVALDPSHSRSDSTN